MIPESLDPMTITSSIPTKYEMLYEAKIHFPVLESPVEWKCVKN